MLMKKMSFVMAMVSAMMASSALALPVYDGKTPRGAQIFVLSNAPVAEAGYHISGPTESYLRRRDAKHLRAAMAAEERLQRQEVLEAARRETKQQQALGSTGVKKVLEERALGHDGMLEPPAYVVEAMQKPAPTRGGIRMGRYGETAPEAPKAEPAPAPQPAKVKAPATAPAPTELKRIVVNPRKLPVYKAGRVTMPEGYFNLGIAESPFTVTELVKLARRGCISLNLVGDTLNINPCGKQGVWLVLEPAAIDRACLGGLRGNYPVKYVAFEPGDAPKRVRILGGYLVLRPEAKQAIIGADVIGRSSDDDTTLRQAEIVEALRKKCRTQQAWGRVLAGAAVALANGSIVKAVTGNSDGFTVQCGLDFPKWQFFEATTAK